MIMKFIIIVAIINLTIVIHALRMEKNVLNAIQIIIFLIMIIVNAIKNQI